MTKRTALSLICLLVGIIVGLLISQAIPSQNASRRAASNGGESLSRPASVRDYAMNSRSTRARVVLSSPFEWYFALFTGTLSTEDRAKVGGNIDRLTSHTQEVICDSYATLLGIGMSDEQAREALECRGRWEIRKVEETTNAYSIHFQGDVTHQVGKCSFPAQPGIDILPQGSSEEPVFILAIARLRVFAAKCSEAETILMSKDGSYLKNPFQIPVEIEDLQRGESEPEPPPFEGTQGIMPYGRLAVMSTLDRFYAISIVDDAVMK